MNTIDETVFEGAYSSEDFCELCAATKRANRQSPNIKVELTHGTLHYNLSVKVCPDCDGGAAKLGTRNNG